MKGKLPRNREEQGRQETGKETNKETVKKIAKQANRTLNTYFVNIYPILTAYPSTFQTFL